ncbi:MAG: hypothetical protein PHI97_17315 [Desulfobulbus sp.]|nr:hypothetical protein [Desulfobulbus sp.]
MFTYAQKQQRNRQTTCSKPQLASRTYSGARHAVHSILHPQITTENSGGKTLFHGVGGEFRDTVRSVVSPQGENDSPRAIDQRPQAKQTSAPSTTVIPYRRSLIASIRRIDQTQPLEHSRPSVNAEMPSSVELSHRDAIPGAEQTRGVDFESALSQTQSFPAQAIPEPQEGETVDLPDIVIAPEVHESDSYAFLLGYSPTINQSGTTGPFGVTRPYHFSLTGTSVTLASGTYIIKAIVDNPITYQVNRGGRVDIASDTDAAITQANYATVASDLTPDMNDLNGRPPRTQFWAEDLCIRHELFHANEGSNYAWSGVAQAQGWLNSQSATGVVQVFTLLGQVLARVIATRSTAMAYPGRENRAYGDGASLYRARANAIKAKGDSNTYGP